MRLAEYTPLALRTEAAPPHIYVNAYEVVNEDSCPIIKAVISERFQKGDLLRQWRLDHALSGLSSEFAEVQDTKDAVDYFEEQGDYWWYFNLACVAIGTTPDEIDCEHLEPDLEPFINIAANVGHLHDLLKRHKYYTTDENYVELNVEKCKEFLAQIKCDLIQSAIDIHEDYEEILEANIAKLKKRYPDKFTTSDALNRNIAEEKKALHGDDDLDEELGKRQKCDENECESCQ